eukprot:1520810-Lingulodinium_polyedra.AAC.1
MAQPGTTPAVPEVSVAIVRNVASASAAAPTTAEAAQQTGEPTGATAPENPLPWMAWPSETRVPQPDFPPELINML